MVTKTYPPSNLCDRSDGSESSDKKNIFTKKTFFEEEKKWPANFFSPKNSNSNCDETQKLKL